MRLTIETLRLIHRGPGTSNTKGAHARDKCWTIDVNDSLALAPSLKAAR